MLPVIVDVPKLELGCTIIIYYYITRNIITLCTLKTVILSKFSDLPPRTDRVLTNSCFMHFISVLSNITC